MPIRMIIIPIPALLIVMVMVTMILTIQDLVTHLTGIHLHTMMTIGTTKIIGQTIPPIETPITVGELHTPGVCRVDTIVERRRGIYLG